MSAANKRWLTRRECSAEYGISVPSLDRDRVDRRVGFPFSKIGRRVVYDRQAMDAFFEARRIG